VAVYNDGDLVLIGYLIDYDQASKSHHIEKVYSKEKVCHFKRRMVEECY